MSRFTIITLAFISVFGLKLIAQVNVGAGTNIGGALPNEKTEGSSAILFPGAYLSFGYAIPLSQRFSFNPNISIDFRMFDYFATQKKDTIVEAFVMGEIRSVPTYYQANIHGKMRLGGIYVEFPFEYRFSKRSRLSFGIYGSALPYKSDNISINVKIGEGGLLPDIDSSYNNKSNINTFDGGLSLGGSIEINDRLSLSVNAYRSLSRFYKMDAVKNDAGEDIAFYYTQVRVGIRYLVSTAE
jgi:hypothetical protein